MVSDPAKIPLEKIPDWVDEYLKPKNGARARSAFQFTINGVTYPFVRDFHFAALPDPPQSRRHSMLGGLFLTRPGDLMFFFQADPQWSATDINSRRGLRGIYQVAGEPFRGLDDVQDPTTTYKILGTCPRCHEPFAMLGKECELCGHPYPQFVIPSRPNRPYHNLVLSLRLEIEPLFVFERAISDERAYADMSDTGMVWIGRHDNQMGPGKGSSVRTLLREEAVKITRMMVSEPEQRVSHPPRVPYALTKSPILNADKSAVTELEVKGVRTPRLVREDTLYFDIARHFDNPKSSFALALGSEYDPNTIEYVASEFPWGYTNGTADFVISLAHNGVRRTVYVIECKSDRINDDAMIQVSLYSRWVTQVMAQFGNPAVTELEIVPVVIGRRLDVGTVRPATFSFGASYNSGAKVQVKVRTPEYVEYVPEDIFTLGDKKYTRRLRYENKTAEIPQIAWIPPVGVVTSGVERDWVKNNSWKIAKGR